MNKALKYRTLMPIFSVLWLSLQAQDWTYTGPGGGNQFYVLDSSTYLVTSEYDSRLLRYVDGIGTVVYDTDTWLNKIVEITDDGQGTLYGLVDIYDSKTILLLQSKDLGKTWEETSINNVSEEQHCLYFRDPLVGFIGGWQDAILRTIDGGQTWERVYHDIYVGIREIEFINPMVGFAVGSRGFPGILLRTTDGGKTWGSWYSCGVGCNSISVSSPCVAYISSDTKVSRIDICTGIFEELNLTVGNDFGPVHFVNDRIGYLSVNENVFGSEGYFDESEIYITYDAGESWHKQSTPEIIAVPSHFRQHGQTLFLNVGNITSKTPDAVYKSQIPPYQTVHITDSVVHVSCGGASDGEIHVSFAGGTPPYEIRWEHDSLAGTDISGLSGGEYVVVVRDSTGLYAAKSLFLREQPVLELTQQTRNETNGRMNGSIQINVNGGVMPYVFQWSHSDTAATSLSTQLGSGYYMVTVTDQDGCSALREVFISNLQINPAYSEYERYTLPQNPVTGEEIVLYALEPFTSSTSYRVLNTIGQTVIDGSVEPGLVLRIDVTSLDPGVYFLALDQDSKLSLVSKVVIQ